MLQPEFPIRIRGFPSKFSAPGTLVDVSFQPDGRAEKCILGLKGGGINYSVAMTALKRIDQGNQVWASAGVTFAY
jgi:hypothetical protein